MLVIESNTERACAYLGLFRMLGADIKIRAYVLQSGRYSLTNVTCLTSFIFV